MAKLDKERWEAVGPLLDQALEMSASARTQWLHELETQDPALAADLNALLAERGAVSQAGFLEGDAAALHGASVREGHTLGAYTLVSRIGEGGMGTIWLARRSDGRFEGQAAVKLLNAHLVGRQGERFEREGSILARLSHPHIAHLVDAGVTAAGQPYLVLEYVEGQHVNRYCESRRLGVEARVRLFLDVLDAVAHAHANLIVHRDLKPSNVLVRNDGEVKLLDFGIAKLLEGEGGGEATALTREGGVMLTPAYAAPEQMTGGPITTATDVYALGVLLFELLSGRHPAGDTALSAGELYRAIVETEPPRLSTVAAHTSARTLRGDLDTIVAKALKKKPNERYPGVAALADDLRRYLDHRPITARPESLPYRAARFVRRHRLPVALASVALVALFAGLAGTVWQAREARRQRDLALSQLARSQAVNEFMEFLLGEGITHNKPLSVSELLQRTEALVEKRFAADPALSVDLLVSIADIYGTRGEEDALRIWKRAYEASLRIPDPAVRANAACSYASVVEYSGDAAGAQRLIDEALASLPRESQFEAIAAHCLLERAGQAEIRDDQAATMAGARQALERLATPTASPWMRAAAFHFLARAHDLRGETASAERAFAEAQRELDRIGATDTNSYITLLANWAQVRSVTDPLGALALQERVIATHAAGAVTYPAVIDHANHGLLLARLERYAEARSAYERSRDMARQTDKPFEVAVADLGLASACRQMGDLPCASGALGEAAPILQSAASRGYSYLGELSREEGLLAAARGDLEGGRRLVLAALPLHAKEQRRNPSEIRTYLELARVEVSLGLAAEAEQHAREALTLAERARHDLPRSAWVGVSQLALGRILEARGDAAAAGRLYHEALDQMTATLGETHPAVKEAKTRLAARP